MTLAALAQPDVDCFLKWAPLACLATVNSDGTPHMTFVGFVWDGESFWCACRKDRVKYINITRNASVGLAINDPLDYLRYVSISGYAELVPDRGDLIVDVFVKKQGPQRGRIDGEAILSAWDFSGLRIVPKKVHLVGFKIGEPTKYDRL